MVIFDGTASFTEVGEAGPSTRENRRSAVSDLRVGRPQKRLMVGGIVVVRDLDADQIMRILESGQLQELVGLAETDSVEFKAQPYDLARDSHKRELAKDVGALANVSGGLILIGVVTERDPSSRGDVVVKLHPIPRERFNADQCQAVIDSWLYRAPKVEIRCFGAGDDAILAALRVYADHQLKPHLTRRPYEDERGRASEIVFGYSVRSGSSVRSFTIEDMQATLRAGLLESALGARLETVEGSLMALHESVSKLHGPESAESRIQWDIFDRINRHTREAQLEERPTYFLAAYPRRPADLHELFTGKSARLPMLLMNPPSARRDGVGLASASETRIIEGKFRVARGEFGDQTLAMWRDGALVFVAPADFDFLCWAGEKRGGVKELVINQLALVESLYDFCSLIEAVFSDISVGGGLTLELGLRRLNPADCKHVLLPGRLDQYSRKRSVAPESSLYRNQELGGASEAADAAYSLLAMVYAWFGYDSDAIPYTRAGEQGRMVLDPESFKRAM